MFKRNGALKIISLLAAVCVWLYVTGEVDPETRSKIAEIPVSLVNTETLEAYGLAAVYDEQVNVSAVVSGKRSDVNDAKKNGITAYVDVAECEKGKNDVKIMVNVPDGINLENISQSTLPIKVEKRITETREVDMEFDKNESSSESTTEKVPWVLDYYPETVTISGAQSSVDKVRNVVGTIDADKAVSNKSKWVDVELSPVDNKGKEVYGLELSFDRGEAEIQLLPTKTVTLQFSGDIKEESADLSKEDLPDHVSIVGTKDDLAKISEVEGTITKEEDGSISISVKLPENVYLLIGENNGKIIWN